MPTDRRVRIEPSEPRVPVLTDPRDLSFPEEDLPEIRLPSHTKPTRQTMNSILQRLKHKSTVYGILQGVATVIAAIFGVSIGEPTLDIAAYIISGLVSIILIFYKPKEATE